MTLRRHRRRRATAPLLLFTAPPDSNSSQTVIVCPPYMLATFKPRLSHRSPRKHSAAPSSSTDKDGALQVPAEGWQNTFRRFSEAIIPNISDIKLFSTAQTSPRHSFVSSDESSSGGDADSESEKPTDRQAGKLESGTADQSQLGREPTERRASLFARTRRKFGRRLTRRTLEAVKYPHTHLVGFEKPKPRQRSPRAAAQQVPQQQESQQSHTPARVSHTPSPDTRAATSWFAVLSENESHRTAESDSSASTPDEELNIPVYRRNLERHKAKVPGRNNFASTASNVYFTSAPDLQATKLDTPDSAHRDTPDAKVLSLEVPDAEASSAEVPGVEAPHVEAPKVEIPKLDIPKILQPTTFSSQRRRRSKSGGSTRRASTSHGGGTSRRRTLTLEPREKQSAVETEIGPDVVYDITDGDRERPLLTRCFKNGKLIRFQPDLLKCRDGIPIADTRHRWSEGKKDPNRYVCQSCHCDLDTLHLHVHDWQRVSVPQFLPPAAIIYFCNADGTSF